VAEYVADSSWACEDTHWRSPNRKRLQTSQHHIVFERRLLRQQADSTKPFQEARKGQTGLSAGQRCPQAVVHPTTEGKMTGFAASTSNPLARSVPLDRNRLARTRCRTQSPSATSHIAHSSTGNGVNVLGARSNTLVLNVGQSVGNGVFVSGGGANTFRIRSVSGNQGDGFVLTDGATNNRVMPDAFVASFTSNRNGVVINNGASGNIVDRFTGTYSRSNGILVHGGLTTDNRILKPVVQTSGGDGIRFEFGANGNTVGYLPANTLFGVTDGSISDNTGAGIRITDPGTDSNFVYRTYFSSLVRTQAVGAVIENGAAHNTLAHRGSRVALYDLKESLEAAREPLPVDFLGAASAIGDAACLESVAAAYARAMEAGLRVDDWWRQRLTDVFRAIAAREQVSRRTTAGKRITSRWREAAAILWP